MTRIIGVAATTAALSLVAGMLTAPAHAAAPARPTTPMTITTTTTTTTRTAPAPARQAPATTPGDHGRHGRPARTHLPTPLVVAHRGASGYRPEHTIGAYELAVAMGADYIEPDLVVTKDGVLVDRHEPEISGTTDVASHPEFASRRTTKTLDGTPVTGWFTEDFTLAELRTLRAKERLPEVRQRNTIYDGREQVPTFEEVLRLRRTLEKKYRRPIGIIPEIKHSTYFHEKGLNPEKSFVQLVRAHGLNRHSAPIWLQSFEITNLRTVRTLGYRGHSTFLAWTGSGPLDGPYDLLSKGDTRKYSDWMTPRGLREIARFADGIGPEKAFVIPTKADGTLGTPTSLVGDAHRVGLQVIPWTFRNENRFMAKEFWNGTDPNAYGKAVEEQVTYLRTGIDGLFTDNPDTGVVAREQFWSQR